LSGQLSVEHDAFLKLLESRILFVSVVAGFILTNLSLSLAQTTSTDPALPSLPACITYMGYVTISTALVVHSILALTLLLFFAAIDLMVIHWLAFNKLNWSLFAYRTNTVFAPFPFVLGVGSVIAFTSARILPQALANSLLHEIQNPFRLFGLACCIGAVMILEQVLGFGDYQKSQMHHNWRDMEFAVFGFLPYIVYFVILIAAPLMHYPTCY
jgi:hypothetical protein